MSQSASVSLEIMGKKFKVNCSPEEKTKIIDAAELVNAKINEVKKHGKSVGSDRITIMAALNIATDYLIQKDIIYQHDETNNYKISKLLSKIEESLQQLK